MVSTIAVCRSLIEAYIHRVTTDRRSISWIIMRNHIRMVRKQMVVMLEKYKRINQGMGEKI